ncbi:glycine--tRNA ligase [Butyricicoccus porcorum]|uniref:Glycine--tRNA ligase n=1 Tax=Butyricicoccus porcorum TaxID=1945634 RepID=A0A252F477_9FIRM|nr:glycine--tRNA ligase [Butyricicoccus porcorum]MCI6926235.1 glycine--tRNA ligase [Butyricicoccus porcorum]MDD6987190.1 glycine--tRNA ligase [Butyricicoccus porcorum]MDY4483256.1 glycine--tRNA ligase [Butyricicoccus porcorum]OUM20559.1 glycine--tRNA ligase [Butyricicoccus porcorum]
MKNTEKTMEKIVALCKGRGFVYSGSEIYGGLANTWDYGPLGVEFKNNVKNAWRKKFIQESPWNVGLDSAILMNPMTWVASGHVGGFSDPLMDCKDCHTRHRADQLIEDATGVNPAGWSNQQMMDFIKEKNIACPDCGGHNFTDIRQFNLMFKTFQGVTENAKSELFLRPETAQGIFVNFQNIQRTTRRKIPFGVGQVGKSFRNEITPGNFTFRTREFEQMELEFFCKPGTDLEWFAYWKDACKNFLLSLGMKEENMRLRDHEQEELSHYSNATTDIEFLFPFGWGELWGIADRTDFDLTQHQKTSGVSMEYFDQEDNTKYIPYVIEPSLGADRVALAFLCDAYDEEVVGQDKKGNDDVRVVLRLHPALAPYKAAVLPLSKKLHDQAMPIYQELAKSFNIDYDEAGSIGKRYRREDEIGTPMCITVDFETETDGCVTIRDRDTMEQVRIPVAEVKDYIAKKCEF